MSRYTARAMCGLIAIAAAASFAAQSQSGQAQTASDNAAPATAASNPTAPAADPDLTPLETVQYVNQKIVDQSRMPNGMDTGDTTIWPGYFAIEESKGTLWWVRGAQTGPSTWEVRYSSVQVDQLDPGFLTVGLGHGSYETVTIRCKTATDAADANPCWHNWVATWDDRSAALSGGAFGDIKVARVADHESQQILDGKDFSVSPLQKQILLFDGKQKQMIDVEPTKPFSELEVYLGAADSDTAQRIFRALKYLLKAMPAAVTEKDPFGP